MIRVDTPSKAILLTAAASYALSFYIICNDIYHKQGAVYTGDPGPEYRIRTVQPTMPIEIYMLSVATTMACLLLSCIENREMFVLCPNFFELVFMLYTEGVYFVGKPLFVCPLC